MEIEEEDPGPNFNNKVIVILGDPNLADVVKPGAKFDEDDLETVSKLKQALNQLLCCRFVYLDNHKTLLSDLADHRTSVSLVFNLCDEGFQNDPCQEHHIPLILEELNLPYTGAGADCMLTCYDKVTVLLLAQKLGIPVPQTFYSPLEVQAYPVIAKPQKGDGGFGITQKNVAYHTGELRAAIALIEKQLKSSNQIFIQEFLPGKDLTLGIIGNPGQELLILPITEEDYSMLPAGLPQIQGYEAKWQPDSPYWQVKSKIAQLPKTVNDEIIANSLKLFERLGCQDYARFDWRLDVQGRPKLLEVNPNPGWCWDGHLAKTAGLFGISYPKMLDLIIKSAEKRIRLQ